MINHILEKNLSYIKKYDIDLSKRIEAINSLTNSIELDETEKKEPNLIFNHMPIHSPKGAEDEAIEIGKSLPHNTANSTHIVFGLGLGYLFKEVCKISQGFVILYEPHLEILRVTLEMVDFSEELSNSRIFITDTLEGLEKLFRGIFTYNAKTTFSFLNFYKFVFEPFMTEAIDKLGRLQSVYSQDTRQRKEQEHLYLYDMITSLPTTINFTPVYELENKFKDIPAIVIGAGPSLSSNIEFIKKYHKKALIFCVSNALKTLLAADITPDFMSVIERFNSSPTIKDLDLTSINLLAEPYTNINVFNLPFKNKFLTPSNEALANVYFRELTNMKDCKFETKGTVSYNALYAAKMLGCNPITLIGVDLAYIDGECYSKNSPFSAIKCIKNIQTQNFEIVINDKNSVGDALFGDSISRELKDLHVDYKIKYLMSQLIILKNQIGEDIPSNQMFALFLEYFKDFATKNPQLTLYNSSQKGASIDGFEYKSFDDIFENLNNTNIDINSILKSVIDNTQKISSFKMTDTINKELLKLKEYKNKIETGKLNFDKFVKEINYRKVLTQNANEYLKKCLNLFIEMNENIARNNILYRIITTNSVASISSTLKKLDGKYDFEAQKEVIKALSTFYIDDLNKLNYTITQLNATKERIK